MAPRPVVRMRRVGLVLSDAPNRSALPELDQVFKHSKKKKILLNVTTENELPRQELCCTAS
jgi:hypothetical protein